MPEQPAIGGSPARAIEHLAVAAWLEAQPSPGEPRSVEALKENGKTIVLRLAGAGEGGSNVIAKRCPRATARVERVLYEEVFPRLPVPTVRYYGHADSGGELCWLFFEDAGDEEYSPASAQHRALAAEWLGRMHGAASEVGAARRLPERGAGYYLSLLRSSREVIQRSSRHPALGADEHAACESVAAQCDFLEARWRQLEDFCGEVPPTVVHGDFVGKNVRVRAASSGAALLPFDWEYAGWGVPAADLTQFSGHTNGPELTAYWLAARQFWPDVRLNYIRRLAKVGTIFRVLTAISWACVGVENEGSGRRAGKLAGKLTYYREWLGGAISAHDREER